MQRRELGGSGIEVPVVTFGAWAVGGWMWGGSDERASIDAIRASIDEGANAIDTAPVYGFGRSEELVGKAIEGRRERALLFTKVGLRWDDPHGEPFFTTHDQDGGKRAIWRNAKPDSVRLEVDRSLARMGVESLDLVQVHWPDLATPIEETMGELLRLRGEGKLRAIGVSNESPERMAAAQAALGDVPLASNQPKYNLLERQIEEDVQPWCAEHGVGLLVYSPLAQGLLTGCASPDREFGTGDQRAGREDWKPAAIALVNAALEEGAGPVADAHGASLSQVVLAWTIAQRGITSVLAGARSPEQALQNAVAGRLELTEEELVRVAAPFERLLAGATPPA
jgi:aryl-alcohol dehydrogenase-like predicted oxidoreductase